MQKDKKKEFIGFRATKAEKQSIDSLVRLTGTNRSTVLRRLVPDLSPRKERHK